MPMLPPVRFLDEVVRPALAARYLPIAFDTREARAVLLAWALYIDGSDTGAGPFGFDRGDVLRVTLNPAVDDAAAIACQDAKIRCSARDIVRRIEKDHVLACRLARLALSLDEHTLPALHPASEEQAWQLLMRVTRGSIAEVWGEEARSTWANRWGEALQAVGA